MNTYLIVFLSQIKQSSFEPSVLRDYHVIPTAKDLPICTPDGFFAKLQSDAVTSTYYCSDREGNAIETFHGIAQNSAQGTSTPNYIDVQRHTVQKI